MPRPTRLRSLRSVTTLIALTVQSVTGAACDRAERVTRRPPATPAAEVDAARPVDESSPFHVLIFSKTAGYRHASIGAGIETVKALAAEHGFETTATEDAGLFTDEGLMPYALVLFLNTTGDVLDEAQQAAMERFIAQGRGFAGVHAAADTEDGLGWAWYEDLIGSPYTDHGDADQPGTLQVAPGAGEHPACAGLPQRWMRNEEWYHFARDVTGLSGVQVLLRLASEDDRPIAWTRTWAGGRSFYTAIGHASDAYSEPLFQQHLLGGLRWAAGRAP